MKKFIILLNLLILLPLTTTNKPLIPIIKTLFTNITNTIPNTKKITHKTKLFHQQTKITPFIIILPNINNKTNLKQNNKTILTHTSSSLNNIKKNILLLFTTHKPQLIIITNNQIKNNLNNKHLNLLIKNHTLTYLHTNL